jgi:hypothetical protein
VLLLYDDVLLPDVRGAVPDGLLYAAVVLEELCPETVALPVTSLTEAVLLVPNELLLVVETRLVTLPDDGDDADGFPAITRLPDVSRRDPLYTSRPKYDPDIGGVTG